MNPIHLFSKALVPFRTRGMEPTQDALGKRRSTPQTHIALTALVKPDLQVFGLWEEVHTEGSCEGHETTVSTPKSTHSVSPKNVKNNTEHVSV